MPSAIERLALLTKDAILLCGENVHLFVEDEHNQFEEICPGRLLGYDVNGVLIRKKNEKNKMQIPWVMIRSIAGCPGGKEHPLRGNKQSGS
jgi:hypothetical protein